MTIRTKLLGTSGLALVTALVVGALGVRGVHEQAETTATVLLYGHASRSQLEADMMHDAIRADVYGALLARGPEGISEARSDLEGHVETLRRAMAANAARPLAPDVLSAISDARTTLDTYANTADTITLRAKENRAAAEALMPDFVAAFEGLEKKMSSVSDAISARAELEETEGIARSERLVNALMLWSVLAALTVGGLSLRIARSIHEAIQGAVAVTQRLSRGDLTVRYFYPGRDEMRTLADGLNNAISAMGAVVQELSDGTRTLSGAAMELTTTADQMAVSSEVTSERATSVSASCAEVQQSASVVASGTEEIAIATQEVSRSVAVAAQVAAETVRLTASTNEALGKLARSGEDIGAITRVISKIAQQTRMLALNANIEAARAGAAGKGFAVVASEVKELARQTEQATEGISQRVATIQDDTSEAVAALKDISASIARVDELSGALKTMMEEQTSTHQEISRTTVDVAKAASAMTNDVSQVVSVAEQSSAAAAQTRAAATGLLKLAESLERAVAAFQVSPTSPGAVTPSSATPASAERRAEGA